MFIILPCHISFPPLLSLTIPRRVKYDRLVADFEALECLRKRHQDQKVTGSKKDPSYDSNQPRATELAAEQYLEATPAAQQTRESVSLEGVDVNAINLCPFQAFLHWYATVLFIAIHVSAVVMIT